MPTPRLAVARAIVPSFSRIDSEGEREQYRQRLFQLWGIAPSARFPGCNPRSVSRATLPQLHAEPQLISLKSDGVRYVLLLTLRPGVGGPVALMIDRAWAMYEVEVLAPEAYFVEGTVLEGELVWRQPDDGTLLYLVFDAVVSKGRNLTREPFRARLAELRRCTSALEHLQHLEVHELEQTVLEMDAITITHFAPRITMRAKSFVSSVHAARLWRERGDMDHRVDGIILNGDTAPYRCGTATAVHKWKPHSTVDLTLHDERLWSSDGPLPEALHGRAVCLQASKLAPAFDGEVMEYLVTTTPTTVLLFPLRKRPDKREANSGRVVLATVSDVLEDVAVEELSDSSAAAQASAAEAGATEAAA